jgi:transposase
MTDEELFMQNILEERDQLFRETSKLRSQIQGYENFESERDLYKKELSQKDAQIAKLLERIDWLQRKIWGKSSESFIANDPQQRILDFDGLDVLPEEKELATSAQEEIEQYKTKRVVEKVKATPVRKPLPENLPRVEIHLYPEGMSRDSIDLNKWTELEPEITEVVEREPAKFFVNRFIRHKFVCKDKRLEVEKPIIIAPMPVLPLAKSYAGASLLSDLVIDKYVNHLPFYRQVQMFSQQGISIAPSTINDWFAGVSDLLRPTYYRLKELVLQSDYIQSDETTIPIIDNEKRKTVKGYIWMVRAVMANLVFFHYDHGSRAQKVALELFKNYQGAIQSNHSAYYR